MSGVNPYQELIGKAWQGLPPGVQQSHAVPQNSRGTFNVERRERGLAGAVARSLKLPKSGSEVQIVLSVREAGARVEWVRQFDDEVLRTVHSFRNGRIEEGIGKAAIVLEITATGNSIKVEQTGAMFLGLRLPRLLAPTVLGTVAPGPDDSAWRVDVLVSHPWLGVLCRYHGIMRSV